MRNTFVALLSILASIAPTCALAQLSPGWLPNISSWEQQETRIYAADTGAANAYTVTLSPAPTIVAGSVVVFKAANANTGASTLAVNGGTATAIRKNVSVALGTFSPARS
jgi:hypothetical protein